MARRASIRIGSAAKISGGKVKVQTMVSNGKATKVTTKTIKTK